MYIHVLDPALTKVSQNFNWNPSLYYSKFGRVTKPDVRVGITFLVDAALEVVRKTTLIANIQPKYFNILLLTVLKIPA